MTLKCGLQVTQGRYTRDFDKRSPHSFVSFLDKNGLIHGYLSSHDLWPCGTDEQILQNSCDETKLQEFESSFVLIVN